MDPVTFSIWCGGGVVTFALLSQAAWFQRWHVLSRFGVLMLCGPLVWLFTLALALNMAAQALKVTSPDQRAQLTGQPPRPTPDTEGLPLDEAITQILGEHLTPGSGTYLSNRAYQLGLKAIQRHEQTKRNDARR